MPDWEDWDALESELILACYNWWEARKSTYDSPQTHQKGRKAIAKKELYRALRNLYGPIENAPDEESR